MRTPLGLFDTLRRLPVLIAVSAGAPLLLMVSRGPVTAQARGADVAAGTTETTEQVSGFQPLDPVGAAVDPSDVRSPEALVATLDEVISGAAGEERDWDRFRSLILPGARLVIARWQTPDGPVEEVRSADVEGFIQAAGESYRQDGFWEARSGAGPSGSAT